MENQNSAYELNELAKKLQGVRITQGLHIQPEETPGVQVPSGILHKYKLIAPEDFTTPDDVRLVLTFCESLRRAIKSHEHICLWAIMESTMNLPNPGHKQIILNCALETAAEEDEMLVVGWILQHEWNTLLDFLEKPFYAAALNNNVPLAGYLMQRLYREERVDTLMNAALLGTDEKHEDPIDHLWLYRAAVVVRALEVSIENGFEVITSILKGPILDVAPEGNGYTISQAFREVATNRYVSFSRKQCMILISEQRMPRILRESIRHRLEFSDPVDITILVGEDSFMVHKDALFFWSGFFVQWHGGTADLVILDGRISQATMKAVLDFMYSGEYKDQESDDREMVLNDVLYAADYLAIPKLWETIRDLLGLSLELVEDDVFLEDK